MAPAVELDGVTKRYGDTAAVDDVSLSAKGSSSRSSAPPAAGRRRRSG